MTTYTVNADGSISPNTFPQPLINDVLQPGNYDQTVATGTAMNVLIDSPSQQNYQFKSLNIGYAIVVNLGGFYSTPSLVGTGNITGSNDTTNTLIAPTFVSSGGTTVDINGIVAVAFTSNGQVTVAAGERLDLEGGFSGVSASAVTVATTGELDLNGQNADSVSTLSSQGAVIVSTPSARLVGNTVLGGSILVQGDAGNGIGNGIRAARTSFNADGSVNTAANGRYVSTLDLRSATFSSAISNLILAQDASISFGTGTTTVARFAVAGSSTGLVPLDLVKVDGTLSITGDGSTAANQVTISQAEFAGIAAATGTGSDTVDFKVAAASGGASLQRQITVDANTILRNDGAMTIGGQGTTTTTIGATNAAAGSTFINGAGAQLTIGTGAALSVASLQNAGAVTIAGNASFLQPIANTGTIDITTGTLSLEGAVQGTGGTFTIESGATLALDAPSAEAIAIRSGGTLRLSQPTTFTGTLQLPSSGGKLDLAGITATGATVSNGTLNVTTSTGTLSFAETGLSTGSTFGFTSDGSGGTILTGATAATSTNSASTSVFRFFDSVHGTQFLTASSSESQMIKSTRPDLVYEGVGLNDVNPATDTNAAPVYRFFDTKFGTHFYTSSSTERDTVTATRPDLVSEGVGFYEHNTPQAGDVPVYRFFDSNFGTHFYTASATERASVIATRPDLISEGISFYAPGSAANTASV